MGKYKCCKCMKEFHYPKLEFELKDNYSLWEFIKMQRNIKVSDIKCPHCGHTKILEVVIK